MNISDKEYDKIQSILSVFVILIIIGSVLVGALQGYGLNEDVYITEEEDYLEKGHPDNNHLSHQITTSKSEGIFLDIIDSSEEAGKHASIMGKQIEGDEHIYVSYYEEGSGDLKIAHNNIDDYEKDWMTWDLGGEVDGGKYTSLEISDDSTAHIVYYDPEGLQLNYATWCIEDNILIDIENIDDYGDVGLYASLELNDDGDPRVSYFSRSKGCLRYAERGKNGGWDTQTVDESGNTIGKYTSLALDDESQPHISYYDWDDRDLKYSYWNNHESVWKNENIEIEGIHAGKYTSIELDEDDVHISTHGWTDDKDHLVYVNHSYERGWDHEIIGGSEPTGTFSSLEISDNGEPFISYHEWAEENLKFAWRSDSGWITSEIDTDSRVGSHTSLHYSGDAEVQIAYHDHGEGDLKHARHFFKNRTPLAPRSFQTRSEHGDIILEWESPIYDGIRSEGDHILGYHVYRRSKEGEFEKIDNVSGLSYTDGIKVENENNVYDYRVAAVNREGVGDNTSVLKTRARYFSYERISEKTNNYRIIEDGLLPLDEDEDPASYEIRWDLDYSLGEEPEWEYKKNSAVMDNDYEDAGLKNVLLEYDNGNGDKRRCIQSAWVLGEFLLTSSYEESNSEERFFHLPEDKTEYDVLSNEDSLKNQYLLKTSDTLTYEHIDFVFQKAEGREEKRCEEPIRVDGRAEWRKIFNVSDTTEDAEVNVQPYLYNEYRGEKENPLDSYHDLELKNTKEVEMIDTPEWFMPLIDVFFGDNLEIENVGDENYHTGWEVEFEKPEFDDKDDVEDKLEEMNMSALEISGADELENLDNLRTFFGGDYGFEMELFPDDDIKFDNQLGFETTLIEFQTDIDEDDMGIDDFEGQLGNSHKYSGEQEMEVSASVRIDLQIKETGIAVSGELGLDVGAGVGIDIPLKSIGFAEVGLTAEIGGEISVEYDIGDMYYGSEGLSFSPVDGEVPIELLLEFGGGPYGEVGAGLAKVEGRLLLEAILDLEIPSLETEFYHSGRFEVEVSAGWGLWSKTEKWELYSTSPSTSSMILMDNDDSVQNQMFTTDRLATRDYEIVDDPTIDEMDSFGHKRNVGPEADPSIASLDEENAIAVWSELSKDKEGSVQSDLFYQTFSEGNWTDSAELLETDGKMAYDPELEIVDDKIALIYKEIEKEPGDFNGSEELESYYKNDILRGKSWDGEWSELGLEHSAENQAITSFDVDVDSEDNIHVVYRSGSPSIDMFDSPASQQGNISVLKQDGEDWEKIYSESDLLPQSSRPSIEFVDGEGAVIYTRTVEDDNGKYGETCYNETVLVSLDENMVEKVVETPNTTSHQLLSEEDGDKVVTWIENNSEIRRKVIGVSSGHKVVHKGEIVMGLSHHVDEDDYFYVFQKGSNAVPTILESTEDGWSRERSLLDKEKYSPDQVDPDLGFDDPKMIMVKEKRTIDSWHIAHHRFEGSVNGDMIEDSSDKDNLGEMRGNWSRNEHDELVEHDRYGRYVTFNGSDSEMVIDHSQSLNFTDKTEDFTVTALINKENIGEGNDLMMKEGSWGVSLEGDELNVKLWDVEKGSYEYSTGIDFPSGWAFFALRYEDGRLEVTLRGYDEVGSLDDHTETIHLDDFDSLASSTEPIKLADGLGSISIDDFRLIKRYLPNSSLQRINRTAQPNFDNEYSVSTEVAPPYVNFTHSETPVVGEDIIFEAESTDEELNYTWTFECSAERYGKEIKHEFFETGYHTVALMAEDTETGAKTRYEKTLHVIDVKPPRFDVEPELEKYDGNNSVRLEWEAAEGESEPFEYRIHHDKRDDVELEQHHWQWRTRETSIVLEGLDPNSEHHLQLSVRNSVGLTNSTSEPISFQIEDGSPPKFDGLESTHVTHSEKSVGLVWYEAADPSMPISYNIYHAHDEEMDFEDPIKTIKRSESEIELEVNVSKIGEHSFAVRAEDAQGNEDENEVVKIAEVKDTKAPEIKITSPTERRYIGDDVKLEWDAEDENSAICHFLVKSDHDDVWREVGKEKNSYTFEGLPEGERNLIVKAFDEYQNSAEDSLILSIVGGVSPDIDLSSPSPEDGSIDVETELDLSVDVGYVGENTIDVHFYSADDQLIGIDEGVSNGEANVRWEGLETDTTYKWYVEAYDGEYSEVSDVWTFKTHSEIKVRHSIEINVEGNGTVDIDPEQEDYRENTEVDLTADPDKGSYFKGWTGDHEGIEDEVTMKMDEDKEITATFGEVEDKLLELRVEGEGDIYPSEGRHTYEKGEKVTITAVPEEDWYLERWTGDHDGAEENITINMHEDKEIIARFSEGEPKRWELDMYLEGEGSIEVDPELDKYKENTEVTIRAIPDNGWNFSHWSGDVSEEGKEYRNITILMYENKVLKAHFENVSQDIEYELDIDVDGNGYTDPEKGKHSYRAGEKLLLSAHPKGDWNFSHWSGDVIDDKINQSEITIIMDKDKSIAANFESIDHEETYDLIIEIEGEGIIEPGEGKYNFHSGEKVYITATGEENWNFSHWSGDITAEKEDLKEITITMKSDVEITANFDEYPGEKSDHTEDDVSDPYPIQIFLGIILIVLIAALIAVHTDLDNRRS